MSTVTIRTKLSTDEVNDVLSEMIDQHIIPWETITKRKKYVGRIRTTEFKMWPNALFYSAPPQIRGRLSRGEDHTLIELRAGIGPGVWLVFSVFASMLIAGLGLGIRNSVHLSVLVFLCLGILINVFTLLVYLVIARSELEMLNRRFSKALKARLDQRELST